MGLMFRRRRPIARLAVGAAAVGVAYHAGNRRPEQDEYNQQAAEAYATTQDQPAPPSHYVAPPPASTGGEVDELSRLAQMHESGALSDDEFAAAKAQLLGT
jgi:Short C-terminal domain